MKSVLSRLLGATRVDSRRPTSVFAILGEGGERCEERRVQAAIPAAVGSLTVSEDEQSSRTFAGGDAVEGVIGGTFADTLAGQQFLTSLTFSGEKGGMQISKAFSTMDLLVDRGGYGYFELLDSSPVRGNKVSFDRFALDVSNVVSYRVNGQLREDVKECDFGLDVTGAKFIDGDNKTISTRLVQYFAAIDALDHVVPEVNHVSVYVDSPTAWTVLAGTKDAVVAEFSTYTSNGAAKMNQLPFALEGTNEFGDRMLNLAKITDNVRVRKIVSGSGGPVGQVYTARLSASGPGYEAYKVGNFPTENGDRFEVLVAISPKADLWGNFRVRVNTDTDTRSATTFDGLFAKARTGFAMQAVDVGSHNAVVSDFEYVQWSNTLMVSPGQLHVQILGTYGYEFAHRGDEDLVGFRFLVTPTQGMDVDFGGLTLMARSGNLLNAKNISLWLDLDKDWDGDVEIGSSVDPQYWLVSVGEALGTLKGGETTQLEVHFDVADVLQPEPWLQLEAWSCWGYKPDGDYVGAGISYWGEPQFYLFN